MYTRWLRLACTTLTVSVITAAMMALPATNIASAHGAVAIGVPTNVGRDGVAIGLAWDLETKAGAIELATSECRKLSGVPSSTLKLCKLARTFEDQCAAAAFDPEPGTPGWGWAIAASSEQAQKDALDSCKRIAGKDRETHCQISTTRCEGIAK